MKSIAYKQTAFLLSAMMIICGSVFLAGCKKYLDTRPDKALEIPSTLADLQALLDNGSYMNGQFSVSFDETSADNYYYPQDIYSSFSPENKDAYVWNNLHYITFPNDWFNLYNVVNAANTILDASGKISVSGKDTITRNNVIGSALFYRAYSFLQGVFIFCPAYDSSTAGRDLGIALRLTSDITAKTTRSTVQEAYGQILTDLNQAVALLPDLPRKVYRPSRASALALLSRTYLSMRNYAAALEKATQSLQIKDALMDYNQQDINGTGPFGQFNTEVLFHNVILQPNYYGVIPYYTRVDSVLAGEYAADDLRKTAFFDYTNPPGAVFKGSYSANETFIGIATDEMWLTRAECEARTGDASGAIGTLNTFLITRWATGTYVPYVAGTAGEDLQLILQERRKELLFRNLRWMDIKRLNKEGANISLTRIINGQTYTLLPNDPRFALAIPQDIVDLTGIPQNPY